MKAEQLQMWVFLAVSAAGVALLWKLTHSADKVGEAFTGAGEKLGLALADWSIPDSQKYLGYPSKFDANTRTWYVQVDGKWVIDMYQTEQARKQIAAKPVGALKK